MKTLRDYQHWALDGNDKFPGIYQSLIDNDSALCVMATGLGKTVVIAKIADEWPNGNVLCLAHRIELLDQMADTLASELGYRPTVEQGMRGTDPEAMFASGHVVVGSIQSMITQKRLKKFREHPFGLIIIDEAHRATSASYVKLVDRIRQLDPNCKVLGVTATPNRTDGTALGLIFRSVAFDMGINQGIDAGWLVQIRQKFAVVEDLDLSKVPCTRNEFGEMDFKQADLQALLSQEGPLHAMSRPVLDLTTDGEQGIIFTASVSHAHLWAAVLNHYRSGCAAAIDGTMPKGEGQPRTETVKRFKDGDIQFLLNFNIACLDEQTEILTANGWKGIDEISMTDRVANWSQGKTWFAPPLALKIRDRRPDEKMVILETGRRSIRVTEDHRMIYRTYSDGEWLVKHAQEIVGSKCRLPVSAVGDPEPMVITGERLPDAKSRLRANSYVLRKQGLSAETALAEAKRRIRFRTNLKYTQPYDLSLDDCCWIGFWLGDGNKTFLKRGGVEYPVYQGSHEPEIAAWFEALSLRCGFSSVKKIKPARTAGGETVIKWSFCRGTGFGSQRRDGGIYRIEPYLEKHGSPFLWALDTAQFEALLHGLWMADGNHGKGGPLPNGGWIAQADRTLLDLIQGIAVCRGYRATLRRKPNGDGVIHNLSFTRTDSYSVGNEPLRFEDEPWKAERVWCVTTDSSFLIARRRGTVTIMGNTEGFDAPGAKFVIMGRPTKSLLVKTQQLGRVTRPLPGVVDGLKTPEERQDAIAASAKPFATALDFVGNLRGDVATVTDILGGNYDVDVRKAADEIIGAQKGNANVLDALNKARASMLLEAEEQKRRPMRNVIQKADVKYHVGDLNKFDGRNGHSKPVVKRGGSTDGQIAGLVNLGIDKDKAMQFSRGQAGAVLSKLRAQRCTVPQARTLKKYGIDPSGMNYDQAHEQIQKIADNGWKRP